MIKLNVIEYLDAALLKKLFLAGAYRLESKKEHINELNVFPVPDGDTGTNMTLTIGSAVSAVNSIEDLNLETLTKAISTGSLRGARGNSGVILSQLFRGFCKEVSKADGKVYVKTLASAFDKAVENAYKAVMKPKEGTILTVAKAGSHRATELENETNDLIYFLTEVIIAMEEALLSTPELLPVLKEAGVVDSGGAGLVEILKGSLDALMGKEVVSMDLPVTEKSPRKYGISDSIETADIRFIYCTEFIIMSKNEFKSENESELKTYLSSIGDCVVVVSDDEIVKVHVHTNDPGLAIQKALSYGELTSLKIDNMREEHNERLIENAEKISKEQNSTLLNETPKEFAFISVCSGSGLAEIFKTLGVDYVIEGGQTMNPSTEDILTAVNNIKANTIFILPNNKNIILAANQAKELTTDKEIIVIPTKTIPQGISAVINYVHGLSSLENEERMTNSLSEIKSGEITYSIRDTSIDGVKISEGDIMGIGDSGILSVSSTILDTLTAMLEKLVDDNSSLISIYYGSEVSEEEATLICNKVKEIYSNLDVELQFGGQPVYYLILSVE